MLTRLKINNFKNLIDVDVRFGPFTCVAGPNAVGKSNLFDAIRFMSLLANDTLLNAALAMRADEGRTSDVRSLFHRVGNAGATTMSFEAEMILPKHGIDDLGQRAEAATTFVRYRLELGYRESDDLPTLGALELLGEYLEHINLSDAPKHLRFPHSAGDWRKSVLKGRRTTPFISTTTESGNRVVKLSQDGRQGRPRSFQADHLPRTVLSTVNAIESPTALLARQEMTSWRLLQLEPSALREPDQFTTPPGLHPNGAHLPATLYALARKANRELKPANGSAASAKTYDQVAARLSELIDDVKQVSVDRDEKRELLTLELVERNGTAYPARSLSDGTLRFLALATIDIDPTMGGVLCLEEPENGIHPARIPAMIRLLQDIACDVDLPVGSDNPLRQVIINTHSPAVVQQVPEGSLLLALPKEIVVTGKRTTSATFAWLKDTWRADAWPEVPPVAIGRLMSYLNPASQPPDRDVSTPRRVIDRSDLQPMLPFPPEID